LGGFGLAAQAQTECAAKSDGDVAVAACVDANGNTAVTAVDSQGNQVTVTEDSNGNTTTEVVEVSK
jgi:2C-methyl-D-erythritol 2,4-cyclodiphosphate synthase